MSGLAFGVLALLAGGAHAAPILDQSQENTAGVSMGICTAGNCHFEYAQVFTVGIAGDLTNFDIFLDQGAPAVDVLWDIRPTVLGVPVADNASTLASGTILGSSLDPLGSFYSVLLASPFAVTVGDVLALSFHASPEVTTTFVNEIRGTATNPYPGGAIYRRGTATGPWSLQSGGSLDAGFRTYVQVVPEPATSSLVGLGLLCMAFARKRRGGLALPAN
ncbi:MAG: PEP-CTERM sorting domain-containing protein [Deltaproteobacteria bacterium]|nr:PEP-CTERM sorting domain-containing protein [Deltaproteobacteria bacterium]